MQAIQTVTVERLGAALGAQVRGVDLRLPVSAQVAEALTQALAEHQVLAFRDQGDLSAEQHVAAAAIWGAPDTAEPFRTVAILDGRARALAEIAIVQERSPESPPFTDQWHMDITYSPSPPTIGTIYAELIPKVGGDTAFVSLCSLYDALSEPMKRLCEGLHGEHSIQPQIDEGFPISERMKALFPDILHPLVQTHPLSGRKLLYISAENTWMRRIVGLHRREAISLLDYLRGELNNIEHQFRWRWAAGDFVVWDQRAVNHMGMADHYSADPYRTVRSVWCYADDRPAARDV